MLRKISIKEHVYYHSMAKPVPRDSTEKPVPRGIMEKPVLRDVTRHSMENLVLRSMSSMEKPFLRESLEK